MKYTINNTWQSVSSTFVQLQNLSGRDMIVNQGLSTPTDNSDSFTLSHGEKLCMFPPVGHNVYVKTNGTNQNGTLITFDLNM